MSVQYPCLPLDYVPVQNQSGPDVPDIYCRPPDDCCAPSPCVVTEDQFICAVRSLLPEGEIYNNTAVAYRDPPVNRGTVTVGCARVGCEQLVFGGCCDDTIFCDDEPIAPQLAVVDVFAVTAYKIIPALCELMRELDPCTARNVRRWADRLGIVYPDPCEGKWSDEALTFLICVLMRNKARIVNWQYLKELAAMFGAQISLRYAGDFNSEPFGWWSMARNQTECERKRCPQGLNEIETDCIERFESMLYLAPTCESLPQSLNVITRPADIEIPDNCNLPMAESPLPHDPERYELFKWLLPKMMPQPAFYCYYEYNPDECIM